MFYLNTFTKNNTDLVVLENNVKPLNKNLKLNISSPTGVYPNLKSTNIHKNTKKK